MLDWNAKRPDLAGPASFACVTYGIGRGDARFRNFELQLAAVDGAFAELFLDAEELVVFRHAIGTAE